MGDLYTKPQAKAGSIDRGLSPNLWNQAPLQQVLGGGLGEGFGFIDDFLTLDLSESGAAADGSDLTVAGSWCLTNATAGTAALDPAAKGGVLLLDSAASTNNQGAQIQYGGAAGVASFIPNVNAKIYYEARIKAADIGSTTVQIFAGLAEVDTTLFATAANTTSNHVGFEAINTTSLSYVHEKADTRVSDTSAGTIADDTYIKVGFLIDGLTSITPFVNGVAGTKQTASIPIVEMTPSFVCHSSGTTDPILHVDWVACIQAEDIAN